MARYNSIVNFSGKVGDLVFARKNKTRYAKAKRTEPIQQTEASKKSSTDFGRASTAAAIIRKEFWPMGAFYADETFINRFNSHMLAVFKSIPKNFIGKKELIQGDVSLLKEFRFSKASGLDTLFKREVAISLLPTGELQIQFPLGDPSYLFKQVARATTVVVQLDLFNMDLDGNDHEHIPINHLAISLVKEFCGATLNIPLNIAGNRLILVSIGVHYRTADDSLIAAKRARAAEMIFATKFRNGVEIPFMEPEIAAAPIKARPTGHDWNLG